MQYIDKIEPLFYIDDEMKKILNEIDTKLNRLTISSKQKKDLLVTKSRVRSVYASLSIEANSLSRLEIEMISEKKRVLGRPREIIEAINAFEVYNHIKEYSFRNEDDLLKAHEIMLKYLVKDNGKYRNHGEAVTNGKEIIYTAPESILVPSLMKSLFDYLNNSEENLLVLSAVFHYYFVVIHPFTDGNGRMARLWSSLILAEYNKNFEFVPVEEDIYFAQEEYYNAIRQCHVNGNANIFIKYILGRINSSLDRIQFKNNYVLNDCQLDILTCIETDKKITQEEIATAMNLSVRTVKRNFKVLLDNGYIRRVGSNKTGYWETIY